MAGILFGIALGMKLLGVISLPIDALTIWLRQLESEVGRAAPCADCKYLMFPCLGWNERKRGLTCCRRFSTVSKGCFPFAADCAGTREVLEELSLRENCVVLAIGCGKRAAS